MPKVSGDDFALKLREVDALANLVSGRREVRDRASLRNELHQVGGIECTVQHGESPGFHRLGLVARRGTWMNPICVSDPSVFDKVEVDGGAQA